jgi:signal transduction histidine kinase
MTFGPVKLSSNIAQKGDDLDIRFDPGAATSLRIQYTAVAFASADQLLFERKLEGLSGTWKRAGVTGKERSAYFTNLKPGHYHFHVRARYPNSGWFEAAVPLSFYIAPHFYETGWFYAVSVGFVSLGAFGFHRRRLSTERKLRSLEQKALLEQERTRIARDMHDTLGANLAKIKLMSETGLQIAEDPSAASEKFSRIAENARTAGRDMDEIIWVLQAREHTVRELVEFLGNYSNDFLEDFGVRFWEEAGSPLPDASLSIDVCHHLFLALKEGLTNIAKHSKARQAWLRIKAGNNMLFLELEDDGDGVLASGAVGSGHGLLNMKARMAALNAGFEWSSEPGKGTRLRISIAY